MLACGLCGRDLLLTREERAGLDEGIRAQIQKKLPAAGAGLGAGGDAWV